MKRVIEIDESIIEHIKDGSFGARPIDRFKLINAFLNSTPLNEVLDKIISDIENIKYLACPQPETVLSDVKDIITKYKEGEDKA